MASSHKSRRLRAYRRHAKIDHHYWLRAWASQAYIAEQCDVPLPPRGPLAPGHYAHEELLAMLALFRGGEMVMTRRERRRALAVCDREILGRDRLQAREIDLD